MKRIYLGVGLELEITEGIYPKAKLYRRDVYIKTVSLSDKTARRLFVVEVVEFGATKNKLAKALGISRQTIHNYLEIQKNFGREGLVNSYQPTNSKSRKTQRKLNKKKLPKGNKAKLVREIRKKERGEIKRNNNQLSLFFK
jgi:transposase